MKKILLASLLILGISGYANAGSGIFEEVSQGIRTGDVKLLSKNFNNSIDLTIGSQENTYSKVQAEQILRDFFISNKPTGFSIIHQGISKEGAKYAIGTLNTADGKNFRVYLYIKQSGSINVINELRFMPE